MINSNEQTLAVSEPSPLFYFLSYLHEVIAENDIYIIGFERTEYLDVFSIKVLPNIVQGIALRMVQRSSDVPGLNNAN